MTAINTATAPAPIRLLLVDDHPLVRDGLRLRLDAIAGFEVVGEAGTAAEALALTESSAPRLVLTDISMKGGSGIALTQAISRRYPTIRILVLSMHNNQEYVAQAVAAGAHGYVLKDSPATQIVEAIYTIARGGTFFDAELAEQKPAASRYGIIEKLTPREHEILRDLASGLSNKQIATLHTLSVRTVETQRMSIKRKLEIDGQAELIKFAVEFFGPR